MKIILTGASGMLGRRVLTALKARGDEVIALGRTRASQSGLIEMDLRDWNAVTLLPTDTDCIVHLAALLPEPGVEHLPYEWYDHNTLPTLNLLKFCSQNSIPSFVYGSSWYVYGDPTSRSLVDEQAELIPNDLYSASKLAGEYICDSYEFYNKMKISKLRFSYIFGPDMRNNTVIMSFLKAAKMGEEITVINGGCDVTDLLYIDDAVQAVLAAINQPCGICNIGGGHPITINDLAHLIVGIVGEEKLLKVEQQTENPRSLHLAINRARKLLSWNPTTSLEEGLTNILSTIS